MTNSERNEFFWKCFAWGYAATAAAWLFCWIPFGAGYYGFPWESHGFRTFVVAGATLHLLAGLGLCVLVRATRKLFWITLLSAGMSVLALITMNNWFHRYVSTLGISLLPELRVRECLFGATPLHGEGRG